MKLGKTFLGVTMTALFLAAGAGSALAYPAKATGATNVRTGPGTDYQKVSALKKGEIVDVQQCQSGWCYVQHNGPDGWVSANRLSGGGGGGSSGGNSDPNFSFSFGFGGNGGNFGFSMGDVPSGPAQPVGACFFTGNNFSGKSFCVNSGGSIGFVGPGWNDKISSVRVFGWASVMMCEHADFGGFCRTTDHDEPALGLFLNDKISSLQVY